MYRSEPRADPRRTPRSEVQRGFDLSTASCKPLFTIMAGHAKFERDRIREGGKSATLRHQGKMEVRVICQIEVRARRYLRLPRQGLNGLVLRKGLPARASLAAP